MVHYPLYTHNLSLVGVCVKRIGKFESSRRGAEGPKGIQIRRTIELFPGTLHTPLHREKAAEILEATAEMANLYAEGHPRLTILYHTPNLSLVGVCVKRIGKV